jgi:L-ascorbate metabolism protein UlaG (beta-lactamase superfamily)
MKSILRRLRVALVAIAVLLAITMAIVPRLWEDRPDTDDLHWALAEAAPGDSGGVRVTWFGISTLLFDDGETQIMIDGAITRLGLREILTLRPVSSDVAAINFTLAEYHINRLAAIIPVHSHFDHAIDAGHIANRTSAVILGSESTANIARGANVPVAQYQTLASGESRQFGNFTITLIQSRHAPIGFGDDAWLPGEIDDPLVQPARVTAWQEGMSYSVIVSHPRGTALIQGSAGYIKNNLRDVTADVVILGVAGIASLGRDYMDELWRQTVTMVGARRVYPVHFDDFTQPFGTIMLFPRIVDNVVETATWMNELANAGPEPIVIQRFPFGVPVALY